MILCLGFPLKNSRLMFEPLGDSSIHRQVSEDARTIFKRIRGKLMDLQRDPGLLRESLGIWVWVYGCLWMFMDVYGCLWMFIKLKNTRKHYTDVTHDTYAHWENDDKPHLGSRMSDELILRNSGMMAVVEEAGTGWNIFPAVSWLSWWQL